MADDIVTRLRNNFATKDYPMLKDHCHCCAIPKEWGGHHDNCLYDEAADEIERLRGLLLIFDTYFVCDECEKACATYLQGCENPLHALHTAAWELF